jgi:hypothetical protein
MLWEGIVTANLETCSVRPLRAYLEASAITAGPLFRPVNLHGRMGSHALSPDAIALVVKRYVTAAGFRWSELRRAQLARRAWRHQRRRVSPNGPS